ncbi:hypothetical protein DL98DRAFT_1001 [Cadophora sp. DSE1049]|nr:hypothetical protein DL98DRAFT_1001 [Cadophora sp. DSE1049]
MDLPNFAHLVQADREHMESLRTQVRAQYTKEQAQRQAASSGVAVHHQTTSSQLPQHSTGTFTGYQPTQPQMGQLPSGRGNPNQPQISQPVMNPYSSGSTGQQAGQVQYGPDSSTPMALRPQQPPVVEFGKATSSTTMNYSGLISQDTKEAAAENHKEIRACKMKRTCKTEFIKLRNGNNLTQSLAVGEGQEGFTLGGIERDQNGNGWLQFAVARTDIVGWVRAEDLEKGQVATQFKVVNLDERPVSNISTQDNGSVLYKTISLLCATIVADKDSLSRLGADALEIEQLGREVASGFTTEFIISMPSLVRRKMDAGKFTLDDLWAIPSGTSWVESADDQRVIIYVILFKGLDGKVGTLGHGFYTGKTTHASKRRDEHWRNLSDPNAKGQMYAAIRPKGNGAGRQYRMLVLCDFTAESNLTRQQKILKYAEHTCVCLFSSWTSILTYNEVDDLALLDKYYFDRAMARAFTAIMEKVSLQALWQIPAGKSLNWTTPLTEAHLRRSAWTCTVFTPDTDTGPIGSYRSGPRTTHLNPAGSTVVRLFTGGGDRRGRVQVSLGTGVDWPKVVTIIVEIYGKGKRHPVPYARFPEPGPFTTCGEFNSIGKSFSFSTS